MTEYGLAPINHDPLFTYAAGSDTLVTSRWLAPEIINPSGKGNNVSVRESKAADVFAFGMFGVEVFTGKEPFEGQKNEAVVLRISGGGRPEMPRNAQAVGLTDEMWRLFESCWHKNPKKRPTMVEVVREWQKFVGNNDCAGGVTKCVQITSNSDLKASSSVPFPTSMIDLVNCHPWQDPYRGLVGLQRGLRLFNRV